MTANRDLNQARRTLDTPAGPVAYYDLNVAPNNTALT